MNKTEVKKIEDKARQLMKSSEFKLKKTKAGSLPFFYYYILEDANFHSENKILQEVDAFQGEYSSDSETYEDYRKSGGKTWEL